MGAIFALSLQIAGNARPLAITERKDPLSKKPILITALISAVSTMLLCFAVQVFTMSDTDKLKLVLLNSYAGDITEEELEKGAARGMVSVLDDPYSVYFDEEEFQMFMEEMDASYTGIGIEVRLLDGRMQVIAPFEGTPAAEAGILAGDILLKVDDLIITEETYADAISRMRTRDAQTPLSLTVLRGDEELTLSVQPRTIQLETVTTEEYGDISYIRIRSFDSPTAGEMAAAIESAEKRNARGLIIDVRDNPGGYLESVADISDMLLPRCTIVYTENKEGKRESLYESDEDCTALPIVLLVNENSASASEVLAGALKDNGRATLVGKKTYGKGSVQSLFKLRQGGAKITVAHYYTSGGYIIDGNGIEPHHTVEKGEGEADLQLQKALELLQSQA